MRSKTDKMPYPKITDIRFTGKGKKNLLTYVNVVFDNNLIVKGLKLVEKPGGGIILAMPSYRGMDDKYHDYVHPINNKYREWLECFIVREYIKWSNNGSSDKKE